MFIDITGIAVKLDSRSALSPLASCSGKVLLCLGRGQGHLFHYILVSVPSLDM